MKRAPVFVLAMVGLAFAGPVLGETIKLQIKGAYWPMCAKVLTKALVEVPGVKVQEAIKAVKLESQQVTVDLDTTKSDVGDVAKAVAASNTPHKEKVEPQAALIVPLKKVTKDDSDKVKKALAGVKGVVAKESTAGQGEVIVQLDNLGGAHLAEITKALKKLE